MTRSFADQSELDAYLAAITEWIDPYSCFEIGSVRNLLRSSNRSGEFLNVVALNGTLVIPGDSVGKL